MDISARVAIGDLHELRSWKSGTASHPGGRGPMLCESNGGSEVDSRPLHFHYFPSNPPSNMWWFSWSQGSQWSVKWEVRAPCCLTPVQAISTQETVLVWSTAPSFLRLQKAVKKSHVEILEEDEMLLQRWTDWAFVTARFHLAPFLQFAQFVPNARDRVLQGCGGCGDLHSQMTQDHQVRAEVLDMRWGRKASLTILLYLSCDNRRSSEPADACDAVEAFAPSAPFRVRNYVERNELRPWQRWTEPTGRFWWLGSVWP